ncbi:MAG: insulinase family protein [Lachnospiraceae bacterium]|nr:insulinase family protein [Lachnospiraceae bacterium]
MKIEELQQYEIVEQREIQDIRSQCSLLRHKKSGAKLALVSNDDENKVFCIGFRTPPEDSTGLPHILEHSVLCGSKQFPAKDPFVELAKGSLNTFLNAITFPDKTIYPIASYNDKDFQNLMHVYMDAVFYPNIYEKEEIFRQEGWHYELDDEESEIRLNGVVYNEMKGAFSSPEGVLEREIMNSLFPDTSYGVESGGDPKVIPELTYSQFLDFHKKYYHPSNSYIYLYGDMDMVQKLEWLDKEYLSNYDVSKIDSELKKQTAFPAMKEISRQYPITEEEDEKNNTYLSFNKVIGTSQDKELNIAFQVLDYALLSTPGAPIKRALMDAGIGRDIMGYYEGELLQPYFTVIAKNANSNQRAQFEQVIIGTLKNTAESGIDPKSIEAAINSMEFKFREADYGNSPKGLMYCLNMFGTWLYEDEKPFTMLELLEVYENLRKKNGTGYFEKLIQQYLIDNTHGSFVVVEPKKGLTAEMDAQTAAKLRDYKEHLSKQQIQQLIKDTKDLKNYQEEPSTKEELESIPLLNVSDIKKEAEPFCNEEKFVDDTLVLYHDVFTNGIGYVQLVFDSTSVPEQLIPYVALLKSVYGFMDTDHYAYGEMANEINVHTGGIAKSVMAYVHKSDKNHLLTNFVFSTKALYGKLPFAFSMIKEMLHHTKFEDEKRLKEIIGELKSKLQMSFQTSGHSAAVGRAASYYSQLAYYGELTDGISYYRFIQDLDENFEEKKEDVIACLKETARCMFRVDNLMVDFTGEEKIFPELAKEIMDLKDTLSKETMPAFSYHFQLEKKNEGFKTSSQIQYVGVSGDFTRKNLPYTGALRVLKNVMSYEYLWMQIRVQGGAYGCMNNFARLGSSYFVSYRDPNLEKTLEVYKKAPEFIRNSKFDQRAMTQFIIGAVSDLDRPLTPASKGRRSYQAYVQGIDEEMIQKERDELLGITPEILSSLAVYIEAMLEENNICVIGNEEKIESQKQLFNQIETL